MIIDTLSNSVLYEHLNPYFKEAFDYLKQVNFSETEIGKIVLHENTLIVNVNTNQLKSFENAKLETHNRFIDIQVPLNCPETFGWKRRCACKNTGTSYDEQKDIEFYNDLASTLFTLLPGEFVVFFPEDAHAPCIGEGEIKKIVIKVAV